MEHCNRCGYPINVRDGYGYYRRDGETFLICTDCVPEWAAEGLVGPAGIKAPWGHPATVFFRSIYRRLRKGLWPFRRQWTIV